MKIDDLPLPTRTKNALTVGGYRTLEQVKEASNRELLALDNFGRESLREIRDMIASCDQASPAAVEQSISLRDHFAALAMQAIIQSFNGWMNDNGEYVTVRPENAAGDAYDYADAMMLARDRQKGALSSSGSAEPPPPLEPFAGRHPTTASGPHSDIGSRTSAADPGAGQEASSTSRSA